MSKKRGKRPGLRARSKNARAKKGDGRKTITLTMDRPLKELLDMVAREACTDIETVVNVLLVIAMHFGRKVGAPETHQMLTDAAARIMELEGKLMHCRQVMEANDPVNARDIFGEPGVGQPAVAVAVADAAAAAPPSGSPAAPHAEELAP